MEKLFKFMQKVIYPALLLMFVVVFFIGVCDFGGGAEGGVWAAVVIMPIPLIVSSVGTIGLFVLRVKEARAERKGKIAEDAEKTE